MKDLEGLRFSLSETGSQWGVLSKGGTYSTHFSKYLLAAVLRIDYWKQGLKQGDRLGAILPIKVRGDGSLKQKRCKRYRLQ